MNTAVDVSFDNVAICVTDLERSISWYEEVLGFTLYYRTFITNIGAEFVLMKRGDLNIEFLHRADTVSGEVMVPGPHLATSGIKAIVFKVTDLEEVTAQLQRLAVPLVWDRQVISDDGLRATMIRDPDGVLINILEYPSA